VRQDGPNEVLAAMLAELGWSPRVLARRINRIHGVGTVAETSPYHWRDYGRVPRPPLPALVAWVLSRELGRPVSVAELWHGKSGPSPLMLPADAGLDHPWTRDGALSVVDDWVVSGLLDRRVFLALSTGAILAAMNPMHLGETPASLPVKGSSRPSGHLLLDQIEQSIPLLQRLDDASGGGTHLPYVGAQFRAVALLLRQQTYRESMERRIFRALAEIGQLAGWMAFDAGEHGLAQRYFLTALRGAREAGDRSMTAHVLGDLAFQAASSGRGADAVTIGQVADATAAKTPATVRASVATRLAYGYAVAGQLREFDRAYKSGLDMLAERSQSDEPAWMYFLTPSHLDAQAGYSLIHAGVLAGASGDRKAERALAGQGRELLSGGAYCAPCDYPGQRRALFEGAWFAVAAACSGDLEQACAVGRTALQRTGSVKSNRSAEVLAILAGKLRTHCQAEHVRDFLQLLNSSHAGSVIGR
jgi:hypothetical protein